jgi:hypothetical protein
MGSKSNQMDPWILLACFLCFLQVLNVSRESYSYMAAQLQGESRLLCSESWSHPDLCSGRCVLPAISACEDTVPR